MSESNPSPSDNFIKQKIEFLIADFGYQLMAEKRIGDKLVFIYKNSVAKIQIEIASHYDSFFYCELRKIRDGVPAAYNNEDYSISNSDLAQVTEGEDYDWLKYYPVSSGWEKTVDNTVEIFKRNQRLLTSDSWIDCARLRQFKNDAFKEKFGVDIPVKLSVMDIIREKIGDLKRDYSIRVLYDSDLAAPYENPGQPEKIEFRIKHTEIRIQQEDVRDDYWFYDLFMNGRRRHKFNSREFGSYPEMVESIFKMILAEME